MEPVTGIATTCWHRLADGRERIEAVDWLETRRFGDMSQQQFTTVEVLSRDGWVEQLGYSLQAGNNQQTMRAMRRENVLHVVRQLDEQTTRQAIAWPDPEAGFFAVERSLRGKPLSAGGSRRISVLVPLFDSRPIEMTLTAKDVETVDIDGQQRELLALEGSMRLDGGRTEVVQYWCDEAGQIVKTRWSALEHVMVRSTPEAARRPVSAETLDLGIDSGVPARVVGVDPHERSRGVYRVRWLDRPMGQVFPSVPGQQVTALEDGSLRIEVAALTPSSRIEASWAAAEPTEEDRGPSPLIDSDDRQVIAIARAAAGSIKDPWEAAQAIETYVHRILHEVDFTQSLSSAAEVARSRRGDCTEHAVLVAACCRALNIPARLAVGLVYSPEHNAFLYHMWNEVWVRDRWLPIDATLGLGGTHAGHLKLTDTNLAGSSVYSLIVPVARLIGKIQIEWEGP